MLKNTKYPVSSEGLLGQASSLVTLAANAQDSYCPHCRDEDAEAPHG